MNAADHRPLEGPRFELTPGDGLFPSLLESIERVPKRLYGIGDPEALRPGVAVIGARKATPYGISCAGRFASHAAMRGLSIISGGARGCDQAAHRAALDVGVPTVVVFGSGADVAYPKSAHGLFQKVIASGGAIVSEQPWGTPPRPPLFPQRNRIIAGLSLLLLIAEAGLPSGTFSTADAALSQGKEVAVVPGAITSPYAKGSNRLMCQGATPVIDDDSFDDALEEAFSRLPLSLLPRGPHVQQGRGGAGCAMQDDPLLAALSADAYTPDELTAYFGFSGAELLRRLSQYEMQGLVERGRDGRYQALPTQRQAGLARKNPPSSAERH